MNQREMRKLEDKEILAIFLLASFLLRISSGVASTIRVLANAGLHGTKEYWLQEVTGLILVAIVVLAVIASLYGINKNTARTFVVFAFGVWGARSAYGFVKYLLNLFEYIEYSSFADIVVILAGFATTVVAIFTSVNAHERNKYPKEMKLIYMVAACIMIVVAVYTIVRNLLNGWTVDIWSWFSLAHTILFWSGLFMWAVVWSES